MFNIDSSTGSLTEVPASPFSIGITASYPQAPTSPSCLAVEPSGQFLYGGFEYGNINGMGAINAFQIDSANLQLLALPIQPTTDIASSLIGMVSAFKGRFLYAGLGLNRATGTQSGETNVYQIDAVTGQLNSTGFAGKPQGLGRSIAVDPVGRFFFEGWGQTAGHIDAAPISPVDGTATTNVATLNLNSGELPQALLPESTGKFLYVQQTSGVAAYSIDATTGVLTQTQSPSQLFSFHTGHAVADPIGPYIYALENDGIHAFQVNPQAGALSELPNSPFPTGGNGNAGIAISGTPSSVQAVSGPAAALFPSSQSLGSVTVGQPGATRVVSATNTGDQVLLLTKISISGPNAGDFSDTTTCAVSLQPNNSCSVSITFTPAAAGLRQATLTITDNAPGSSQSVTLSGTGLAQQPDVTLSPASLSFSTTNQGSTSSAQTVSITNDGTTSLHITSISLATASANASDFAIVSNTCPTVLAVEAACAVSATFSPLGNGPRSASIAIVDDAPDSPQEVPLTGTGTGTPVTRPGISLSPTSISFPATTQNATSPAQSLAITNSGTGTLHISSIALGGSDPTDFSTTSTCTAPAYVPGATCSVSLTFTPLAVGPRSATLVISSDAPNSPQTVSVGGLGNSISQPISAPELTVNGGTPQSIKAGDSATWNLTLIPNFTGNLTFTCAGYPSAASCSTPQTMKVTAGTSVPAQIKIATTGSASAQTLPQTSNLRQRPLHLPAFQKPTLLSFIAFVSLLLAFVSFQLVFAPLLRKSSLAARLRATPACSTSRPAPLTAAAILALTLVSTSGCGAGATTAQSVPVTQPATTPQGTYTIMVSLAATPTDGKTLTPIPPILLSLTVQ
jgi:6-phosphogluconolactonase (cycloisomerase 2 family)